MSETKEEKQKPKAMPSVSTVHIKGAEPEDGLLVELNRFEARLNNESERGKPVAYEVKVDRLPVILKTRDASAFASILDEIDFNRTKEVEIRVYSGTSTHHHKHLIYIDRNRNDQHDASGLAGVDERIMGMRRQWEHEQLVKDHEELKRRHGVLEQYKDRLEDELEEYRAKRLHVGNLDLIEVGGMLLEGFIRRNPHALSAIPGGDALAGALLAPPPPANTQANADATSATATRRQPVQPTGEELAFLDVIRQVQGRFDEGQFMQVLTIIDQLSNNPSRIPATLEAAMRGGTAKQP
jgi:hypothetical protein